MRTQILIGTALALATVSTLHADLVYRNSTTDLNQRLAAGTVEIGDELILAGTFRNLSSFDFQYYGISFSGNEQARVRLYANDGASIDAKTFLPNTVLFDSGTFNVSATAGNTLIFSTADGSLPNNIVLPNHVTLSVQFSGITAGEDAGVELYGPPTVGLSERDYWFRDPVNGWQTRTNASVAINFGATVQAVPEPSTWALGLIGGIAGFLYMRRAKKA